MESSSKPIVVKTPTDKQLVRWAKSGEQGCPVCKADQSFVGCQPPTNEDGVVIQCCECTRCSSTWNECFYRGDISDVQITPDV